jgi:hypothetical protein
MRTKIHFRSGPQLRPQAIALVEKLMEELGIDVLRSSDPSVAQHRVKTVDELKLELSGSVGFWIDERKS